MQYVARPFDSLLYIVSSGLIECNSEKIMLDNVLKHGYNITCVYGMWHSLVARFVRDEEAAGSNPVIPTINSKWQSPAEEISGGFLYLWI